MTLAIAHEIPSHDNYVRLIVIGADGERDIFIIGTRLASVALEFLESHA